MNTPGYESLANVLQRAYDQAAQGKGAKRHANSLPFDKQPMQSLSTLLGDHTGLLYQAMKKIQESTRMDKDAAVRELLGAINYCAGAVIFLEAGVVTPQATPGAGTFEDLAETMDHYPLPMTLKKTGDWTCRHGDDNILPSIVPVGEACPVCFSTK